MRSYGLYDTTRGLLTALAVGVAGLLLWVASQVGQQTTGRFWAEVGIVAAAGFVVAMLPVLGSWSGGLRLRVSPGTFLLGFLPTLVLVGWILLATQPGNGWHDGTLESWSRNVGIMDVVHDLGLWHGVLAFGFGLVLGMSLDTVPARHRDAVVVDRRRRAVGPAPTRQRRSVDDERAVADEPLTAERDAREEPAAVPAGRPIERRRGDVIE